jgi:hypothetical protein
MTRRLIVSPSMVKKSPTGDVPPAPEQVDLDGDAVPVDDERSRRGSHVGALEEGVAVEAADRLTPAEGAGIGDELGVVGEAGGDGVGVVGGDGGEVGVGDVGRGGHEDCLARLLGSVRGPGVSVPAWRRP